MHACSTRRPRPAHCNAGFLSLLSKVVGAYGLLFLFYNFYLEPGQRFLVNVALRLAALASMSFTLWPVGSAVAAAKSAADAADPLRGLWELLYMPIIPGISFTVFSWGVSASPGAVAAGCRGVTRWESASRGAVAAGLSRHGRPAASAACLPHVGGEWHRCASQLGHRVVRDNPWFCTLPGCR